MTKKSLTLALSFLAALVTAEHAQAQQPALEQIKERGKVLCAIPNGARPGYAFLDSANRWAGMDIDMCRAVAAALFDNPDAIDFKPLSWPQRFPALQTGEVDFISYTTTWILSRDTELGLNFSRPYYFGEIGVVAYADLKVTSLTEMDGASICLPSGTTFEKTIASWFASHKMTFTAVTFENVNDVQKAYLERRCDAWMANKTQIQTARFIESKNPDDHVVLKEVLSLDPNGYVVTQSKTDLLDLLNWVINVMIDAEDRGITSANVDEMRTSAAGDAFVSKLLGVSPGMGTGLKLDDAWAYRVIKHLGNYGEMWDRNLGANSPFKRDRGYNALVKDGGLHYPVSID